MADLTNKTQNLVDNNAGGGGDSPRPKHRLTTFIEKNILGRNTE